MGADERMSTYEEARLLVARTGVESQAELDDAIAKATEAASEALAVDRTSVWLLEDDVLSCVHLHVRGRGRVECDSRFTMSEFPAYAKAGRTRKVLASEDARRDPITREFLERYLVPNGIYSMLDAPLFRSGEVIGMICHEHCGDAPRTWSTRDIDFAGSMADLVSLAFEQAARTEAERARAVAEQRLAAQERMASLGRLAAGVAHDLSNLLQLASLQVSLLSREALSPVGRDAISLLEDTVERETRLLQQLLVFAKNGRMVRNRLDVGEVLLAMRPLLSGLAGHGRLTFAAGDRDLACLMDRAQLEQVILNLVRNAFDASPAGEVAVRLARADSRVVIEVSDDGPGVPDELRERVFEPFFTTKERGSGLGLAVVRAIAEANGGTLSLDKGARGGASFRLTFPLAD